MMRKITMFILSIAVLFLVACSGEKNQIEKDGGKSTRSSKEAEELEEGGIGVDKGLLNVEINLPETFFEGQDIDEIIEGAKEEGIANVTKNDDGSLTYKMSKSEHKKLMIEMKDELIAYVSELEENNEDYPSIKEVMYEKSLKAFTLVVDREAFEDSFEGFAVMGLGMAGMSYQLFDGVDLEKNKVKIYLKDIEAGEIYSEVVYPDAFDEE